MHSLRRSSLTTCFLVLAASIASGQTLAVSAQSDLPPGDLADSIGALMTTGGQRVGVEGTTIELWWVKTLPLTSESSNVSWASVEEGTLVGSVTLSTPYPDLRGMLVPAGTYTLRYGLQPQNGDHLGGVSPSRECLLLAPAAEDEKTAPLGHDDAVALSRETPGASHPPAWSIDPPAAAGAAGTTRAIDGGQMAVIVAVPASRDGKDAGTLTFGVVLAGTIQPR